MTACTAQIVCVVALFLVARQSASPEARPPPAGAYRNPLDVVAADPFVYREVDADAARALFAEQPYKLELIAGLAKGETDEYGNEAAARVAC